MPNETMTPSERWQAVLDGASPTGCRWTIGPPTETRRSLRQRLGCRTTRQALEKLHVDFVVKPEPEYAGPRLPPAYRRLRLPVSPTSTTGRASMMNASAIPLAGFRSAEEIERNYRWPEPGLVGLSRASGASVQGKETYPLRGGGSEPFLTYKYLRGQEQAFIDLVENPEIVHYCLGKLFDLAYENTRRIFEALPGRDHSATWPRTWAARPDLMFSRPPHPRIPPARA